ncbi:MAG TPA: YafY family protein [Chitinophagaceae bacterium]|nr:YafY family protein [Chitinophagaceae bacterium]HEX5652032.1 YafY family protein [Chitinophagaceae bacterium]
MNRVDRLHAILVHLQSKRKVTAQELADRFELSLRTVYRDVKALEESGIPIIGEAGIGYSVMEGYRLPPVMFTQEEASALLLGGKLLQQLTDTAVKKHFDSAMFKIKAVLRSSDKDHVEELDNRIAIHTSPIPVDESMQLHLTAMRQAIVDKKVISLEYHSPYKEETTEREAEPIGLFYYGQAWHFIGWCRLRKDYRDFRLDRIRKLVLKDERFDDTPHPTMTEYIQELSSEKNLQEMIVSFDKDVVRYLQSQKYFYGFVSQEEKQGRIHMRFLTAHSEYFARWLLSYTDMVKIESPAWLHEVMQNLMAGLVAHYK